MCNYAYEGTANVQLQFILFLKFNYNLWMGYLHPDSSCQLLCPIINIAMSNNFKHSHMCTLHNFFSNKARFIHTLSTVII